MTHGPPLEDNPTWRFSRSFWTANGVELLERAAWYGVFVAITLYLSRILGFSDIEAATISGLFSAGLYFLPTFSGALADKMGYRVSLLLAFGLLSLGYGSMWLLPTVFEGAGLVDYGREVQFHGLDTSWYKWLFVPVMLLVMVGGSFIKSVITATVARESSASNRARGYSIFYAIVNIGAFSGKTVVKPLRDMMGNEGLIYLNVVAAGLTFLAFVLVALFYRETNRDDEEAKSLAQIWASLVAVCKNARLVFLTLIITGFWMVQHQLYATMPKYVLRMAGEGASPSWYANVNPAVVVLTVALITQWLRKRTALFSMTVGARLGLLHGRRQSHRRREHPGPAPHCLHDDPGYCLPGDGREFHLPALPGVLLPPGTPRRGGSLPGLQSPALLHLKHPGLWPLWYIALSLLPGSKAALRS